MNLYAHIGQRVLKKSGKENNVGNTVSDLIGYDEHINKICPSTVQSNSCHIC